MRKRLFLWLLGGLLDASERGACREVGVSAVAIVPSFSDETPVPAQDGVDRDDGNQPLSGRDH
jgi:hypothetical protein